MVHKVLEVVSLEIREENKEEIYNLVDNPALLFGDVKSPYCILLEELAVLKYGGGIQCIFGYKYGSDKYGFQLLMKYTGLKWRRKYNGVWSDWALIVPQ